MDNSPSQISLASLVIAPWEIQSIEGKLLTIVESIGLPQKQEEAVKGLVRQAIWDKLNYSDSRLYVYDDMFIPLQESNKKVRSSWQEITPAIKKSK